MFDLTATLGSDSALHEGETRFHASSVSSVDPGRLIGPAVVVDIADDDDLLRVSDLVAWEARNGPIPSGAVVLARIGRSGVGVPIGDAGARDPDGGLPEAGWSVEAVRFLLDERAVSGAGIDARAFDPGHAGEPMARRAWLEGDRWALEGLDGLGVLPEAGATVVVLPIAFPGVSMAPARAIAVLPR